MMAVDFCADGKIDTIPALWNLISGNSGSAAGSHVAPSNPYILAAAGVFAIGTAAVTLVQNIIDEHQLCRQSLVSAVNVVGAAMQNNIMRNYDAMMDALRETIENRLNERYQEAQTFGDQESAIKMIAQVYRAKNDLLGNINVDQILA